MHAHLIPGFPIQTFGLCIAIGFYLSWMLVERLSGRKDLSNLIFLMIAAGIVGARLAHVVEYWHADGFDRNLLQAFQIWKGGLVFYGGLIAGVLTFLLWCRRYKADVLRLADLFCVAIPLGHACGRIGCFCFGCCWGKVTQGPLGLTFPVTSPVYGDQLHRGLITTQATRSLPVLPTQLIEAAGLLALLALLIFLYRRYRAWTAAAYFVGYGVLRFFIEFLRDDDRPVWGGLSSAQNVSLLLILCGLGFAYWSHKRHVSGSSDHR